MSLESPTLATRGHQMFPVLDALELERVRRFGVTRSYDAGDYLVKVGRLSDGLMIILSGSVAVSRRDLSGMEEQIVTYGPGAFLGELGQLTGRPSLVDARANGAVSVLVIAPDQLRALLIGEAELGERIFRALILRRVAMLESGTGGPVIVGRPDDRQVLPLVEFLRRNGHPQRTLNPDEDAEAATTIAESGIRP